MIAKILEVFFRHKALLALPIVLVPLIVTPITLLTSPPYYESAAGVWVGRATYLKTQDEVNRYRTPSQNQAIRLSELLNTRSFQVDVAQRTSFSGLVGSLRGEKRLSDMLTKEVTISPTGENLLVLRSRAATGQLAYEVVNGIVETYKDRMAVESTQQADLATALYQDQIQQADQRVAEATRALQSYLAASANSGVREPTPVAATSLSPDPAAIASLDPRIADLQARLAQERDLGQQARAALQQATNDAAAAIEGQDVGFQLLDPPMVAPSPTRDLRKVLVFPIAALVAGLGLSVVMLILLVAADRSVRTESDLVPPVRLLGTLPRLTSRAISRKAGPDATRRAIGFVAGAALPAPTMGKS